MTLVNGVDVLKTAARETPTRSVTLNSEQVTDVINHIVMADTRLASSAGFNRVLQGKLHEALESERAIG